MGKTCVVDRIPRPLFESIARRQVWIVELVFPFVHFFPTSHLSIWARGVDRSINLKDEARRPLPATLCVRGPGGGLDQGW